MDIHVLSKIRTRSPNNRAVANLGLRPHGHRDRLPIHYALVIVPLNNTQLEVLRASLNNLVCLSWDDATRRDAVFQQATNISKDTAGLIFRAE